MNFILLQKADRQTGWIFSETATTILQYSASHYGIIMSMGILLLRYAVYILVGWTYLGGIVVVDNCETLMFNIFGIEKQMQGQIFILQ